MPLASLISEVCLVFPTCLLRSSLMLFLFIFIVFDTNLFSHFLLKSAFL